MTSKPELLQNGLYENELDLYENAQMRQKSTEAKVNSDICHTNYLHPNDETI